jgi:hypothetical protein
MMGQRGFWRGERAGVIFIPGPRYFFVLAEAAFALALNLW